MAEKIKPEGTEGTGAKTAARKDRAKTTSERVSVRDDGRLSTVLYLKADLLDAVQNAAKDNHQPTWAYVEAILERAMKRRAK